MEPGSVHGRGQRLPVSMKRLPSLLENNRRWAQSVTERDPVFFETLARQQSPEYLWIGCSDSRVPANEIVNLLPGELFVHRNVANVVVHSDLNCLSVIQYAVEVLKVKHIIVCGHYRCGGVAAAMEGFGHGLVDNWLGHIRDVEERHHAQIGKIPTGAARLDRLCELNVIEQVANVCSTTVAGGAWAAGSPLTVHGWIYDVADGLLRDLGICVSGLDELREEYARAVGGDAE